MRNVSRRKITNALLVHLRNELDKPVGDTDKPADGGYQGEWGESDFVPYVVLTPEGGTEGSGPLSDPQDDIMWGYSITAVGISRDQCEWMLDQSRNIIFEFKRSDIDMGDSTTRRVRDVVVSSYGAVDRTEGPEPHWWIGSDSIRLDTTP